MAPKQKESHAERAARLQRKSLELQHRDTRLRIQEVMKSEPDVLPKLRDFLQSIGKWDALSTGKPELKSLEDGDAGPDGSPDGSPPGSSTPNKSFTKLENMPLCHMKRWLSLMEPIAFSEGQLRALVKRGSRDASRASLAELMEFTTSIDPTVPLFQTGREDLNMECFEQKLVQMDLDIGRRARDFQLPPMWLLAGIYKLESKSNILTLTHKFTQQSAKVPKSIMDTVASHDEVHILLNFSEHRAVCQGRATGPFDAMLCSAILQLQEVVEPPLKKARHFRALCDADGAQPEVEEAAGTLAEEEEEATSEADAAAGGRSDPGSPAPAAAKAIKDLGGTIVDAKAKDPGGDGLDEVQFVPHAVPAGARG